MKKLAVIGNPISHSLSPSIHGIFAKTLGIDIQYDAVEVETKGFEDRLASLFSEGYSGLNVTLPLKETSICFSKKTHRNLFCNPVC